MKNTVNFYEFSRWFEEHRPNNFSRAGLQSLFDYLEEYEKDCDTEIEFDPIRRNKRLHTSNRGRKR